MLMIRFQRIGRTNDPAFRISVLEKERAAQAGNVVEQVGTYNPKTKAVTLDAEAIKGWMAKGAQPTDSVKNLLIVQGVIEGKKVNVLPKKSPIKSQEQIDAEAAAAEAAAAPAEEAPTEEAAAPAEEAPAAEAELPSEAETEAEAEPAPAEEAPAEEEKPAEEAAA